jgi:lipopolysaccharide transport system ATP-binding protein
VGALLDVGTGFQPELTGRENTFLSGAILGLSRRDVASRFDAIVSFAELDRFMDLPVKHYSSGMYARLGFAVAAHLLPNVLIVDEVLAVGDLAFQAKCLAHMHRLTDDGTSILFVSHNMLAVADLCSRALVIDGGRLVFDGLAAAGILEYRRRLRQDGGSENVAGGPRSRLVVDGTPASDPLERAPNDRLSLAVDIERPATDPVRPVVLNLVIESATGPPAIHLRSDVEGAELELRPGGNVLTLDIDDLSLAPGDYWMWLRVTSLGRAAPVIWDTERVALTIAGDRRLEGVARPRHRFGQRSEPG